jgi:hypothetical protein
MRDACDLGESSVGLHARRGIGGLRILNLLINVAAPQRECEDLPHLDALWAILTEKDKHFREWNRAE